MEGTGMTQFVLAAVLGLLFALATYLILQRDVVRVVWGVAIIGQAANVYLVTMGGFGGGVPIGGHGGASGSVTDPLVQALVLTAIVIGFGTTAFALALTFRVYQEHGTIDVSELGRSRPAETEAVDSGADAGSAAADTDTAGAGATEPATDGGEEA
jgi:multicomponent Na+:H+ antiporter subunit C